MRTSFFIHSLELIISALGEQTANGNMHQILFLFFGKFLPHFAQFLYANQKKNCFHIRLFSKAFHQLRFQCPPPELDIFFTIHAAKITRRRNLSRINYLCRNFWIMLQLAVIRQHPEFVKERLMVKNLDAGSLVDSILALDEQKKKLQLELETAQSRLNSISKEIGQWIAKGDQVKTDEKKREVAAFKASIPPLQEKSNQLDQQLQNLLVTLPNLPAKEVPLGKTPEDNVVVRIGGEQPG